MMSCYAAVGYIRSVSLSAM